MSYDRRNTYKEIFQDTMRLCRTHDRLKQAVAESARKQYIVEEKAQPAAQEARRHEEPAKIVVSGKRSLEAAGNQDYAGLKICVHNFASATNPGGGVENGASAQEECICRCSTLYPNISADEVRRGYYQRHKTLLKQGKMDATYNDDCIFTPGVVVFKTDDGDYRTMEEAAWYSVDIITCAAPNLRAHPSNAMNPDSGSEAVSVSAARLKELHIKRLRRILSIARRENEDVVILGAFGCGAFQNPAWLVAEAFQEAVQEFLYDFRVIEFAVYCRPGDQRNYEAFEKVFGKQ